MLLIGVVFIYGSLLVAVLSYVRGSRKDTS